MAAEPASDEEWVVDLPDSYTQTVELSSAEKAVELFWPDWKLVERLGQGLEGSVFKVRKRVQGGYMHAAVKIIEISDELHDKLVGDRVASEIGTLLELKGESNIVLIEDATALVPNPFKPGWLMGIRMEFLHGLAKRQSVLGHSFDAAEAVRCATDISKALIVCGEHHFVHRDVKAANIFWSPKANEYKLGDFGVTTRLGDFGRGMGTMPFMAPEIANRTGNFTYKVDVYSLGMVLFYLLNGNRPPFAAPYPAPVTEEVRKESERRRFQGERLPDPRNGDRYLADVVRSACEPDPSLRLGNAHALHSALQGWGRLQASHDSRRLNDDWSYRSDECPSCGFRMPAGSSSRFCLECGTDLAGFADDTLVLTCRFCGKGLSGGSKVCPHCGKPQNTPHSKKLAIVAGLAVVLACCIGVFANFNPKTPESPLEGSWYLVSGDAPSMTADNVVDMYSLGLGSTLELGGDGLGSFELAGDKESVSWNDGGDGNGTVNIGGERYSAHAGGADSSGDGSDQLGDHLELDGYNGYDLVFSHESPERVYSGYILGDSDRRVYRDDELKGLTDFELCLARNEIYIRKGHVLESERIMQHYGDLGLPGTGLDEVDLNPIENTNVAAIARVEWTRNSIYRNMLSLSRLECYLAFSAELARHGSGSVRLAQLVDFDGSAETFEELLVVYSNGDSLDVNLLGYSKGAIKVEESEEIPLSTNLSLVQYEKGYALQADSEDLGWGKARGEVLCEVGYQLDASAPVASSDPDEGIIGLSLEDASALTRETLAIVKADYCDNSPFYGVWLPSVDDIDEAWEQCVKLQALGFDSWKVQPSGWSGLDDDEDTYMVTAGRFSTKAEARDALDRLEKLGYENLEVSSSGKYLMS